MPKFETVIQPWGNSLGLRITRPIRDLYHLNNGTPVVIDVSEDGVLIRRKEKQEKVNFPFSENELLKGMTRYSAHADELPIPIASEVPD